MDLNRSGAYRPTINNGKCSSCGLCMKICPVLDFDEKEAEASRHSASKMNYNPVFGFYSGLYASYSLDQELRFNSASGGFVTSLLLSLLQTGEIDQAVVVRQMSSGLEGYASVVVSSPEDIIDARASKYVPVQRADSIRKMLAEGGRVAFVGLPCQVAALSRALQHSKVLKARVRFTIALFCGGTSSLNATRYLLHQLRINRDDVERITYRGGGWPGNMTIQTRDGQTTVVPYRDVRAMGAVFSSPLFRPLACAMCSDPFGRLADVSTGDAWLKRFESDRLGRNIVISRTRKIDDALRTADDKLRLELASERDVVQSNLGLVRAKYINLFAKAKYFEKVYGQPYKAPKDSFYVKGTSEEGWNTRVFLLAVKYLSFLSEGKWIKVVPLRLIEALKVLPYLERKVAAINYSDHYSNEGVSGKVKNVLIINHLSFNKGNHAVLRTILQELSAAYGSTVHVVVSSDDKKLTETRDGVEAFSWPFDIHPIKLRKGLVGRVVAASRQLLASICLLFTWGVTRRGRILRKHFNSADLVITPGGHLFTTMNNILAVWNYTLSVLLAKKAGKPVVGLAQSVGPFSGMFGGLSRALARKAILSMDKILLREDTAVSTLRAMRIPESRYSLAGEMVYLLGDKTAKTPETGTIREGRERVGVTIHHIYFKYHMSKEDYLSHMSRFFNSLLKKHGNIDLVFLPMEYTTEGPRDRVMINEIIELIHNKAAVQILERDAGPEELVDMIRGFDFFIGTKTHSIVMALQSCIPTLSISYHEKSKFFMDEWGVGDYSIYLKDISGDRLDSLFDRLYERRQTVRTVLRQKREINLANAAKNTDLMKEYL
jgi:coenzyme F420 hydrogenase subunit beta